MSPDTAQEPISKIRVSLGIAWCVMLVAGLSYYLIRSWKRRVVTTPARFAKDVSRVENPGMYWFAMSIWLIFDLLAIGGLLFGIYEFFKPAL